MRVTQVKPKTRLQPRKPAPELLHYIDQKPKPIQQQILELRARIHDLRLATYQLLERYTQ